MNKADQKNKALARNYLRFVCFIIGFIFLVNPGDVGAKTTKSQNTSTTKAEKKSKKPKKSKPTTTKSSKKRVEETTEPAPIKTAIDIMPEPDISPEPTETEEPEEIEQPQKVLQEDAAVDGALLSDDSTKKSRSYRISVGPLLGVRTMKLQGDRGSYEHNAPFYMGGMLDGELRLYRLSGIDGELWFQADAGYGTTIGAFGHADLANRSTAMAFLSGQLLMKRNFGDNWDMQFGLGMQALSLTVEPNATYTGHRYIGPEIGLSGRRWFDNHRLLLGAELYALPVLWANHSGKTDDAQSFGFRAGAELGWSPGEGSWALRLRYRFQRFRTQFPLASEGSRGAISEDNQHIIMLMLSY